MSSYRIAVLAGDGIGPETTAEALKAADAAALATGLPALDYEHLDASAQRWVDTGVAMTDEQYDACAAADAIYMGAIGLPEARHPDGREVNGDVIFRLRFGLDLFAGIRPIRTLPGVPSPLAKPEGIDYVVVRENVEGLYASRTGGTNVRGEVATDTIVITKVGTQKVVRQAFELARARHEKNPERPAKVTCVDKANVLSSYAYFRSVFDEVAAEYPDVEADYAYVDAMTAFQVLRPQQYDVLVAENMFGDIISDLAAASVGGLGLSGSGDVGHDHGLFQSSHGSAPDIAGKGIANPVAAILSAGIMLDWLGRRSGDQAAVEAGALVDAAVEHALQDPANRTPDLGGTATTVELGDAVVRSIQALAAERA
ncbi:isocitrate/isopropylmalate dehydrogenase family protein [Homoserinibacter sp. YIM 151385]|uniref:isocitrate/isopropylmalate dehydrogenase family protein n=1 Tax=Homoserinibacter sp. YIM 151385 TaxID=2985506 RepID=UPI0022F12569|nr:isocitrate/isopropylmalate family dehydrogenase [Homoserinibacter sp. YIM 151385]WBU37090.1 isocitrate/isopropylmalate family dehydrogenase [Homoserinibacter sp. YIM 151385]